LRLEFIANYSAVQPNEKETDFINYLKMKRPSFGVSLRQLFLTTQKWETKDDEPD